MLKRNDELTNKFDSLLTGMAHPFTSTCVSSDAIQNRYDRNEPNMEQVSFLGWFHAKESGRLMKTSLPNLIVPKIQLDFCRQ